MNSNTTGQPNVLHRLIKGVDVYVTLDEYQDEQSALFERILQGAYDSKKIDEVSYRRLIGEIQRFDEWSSAFDHYAKIMSELVTVLEAHLHERIVKGAEYIESIGENHPKYMQAMKKYDVLCHEYTRSKHKNGA